jgi:hypothetical protein
MAFLEDLDQFFSVADFATDATLKPGLPGQSVIKVIFDAATAGTVVYETQVEEAAPSFLCKSADVGTLKRKDKVRIGTQEATVEKIEHDGTGTATVRLSHLVTF